MTLNHRLGNLLQNQTQRSTKKNPFPQNQVDNSVRSSSEKVLDEAGKYFNQGLLKLQSNRRQDARNYFDKSVEVFLDSTLDINRVVKIRDCFNQLVETIYRIEFSVKSQPPLIKELSANCGWRIENKSVESIAKIVQTGYLGFTSQEFKPSSKDDLQIEGTMIPTQQKKLIGTVNSARAGNNPGCSYFAAGRLIFVLDAIDGTWMNIDGREVTLTLVKETGSNGKLKVGSRSASRYVSGDITVDMIEVITKLGKYVSKMSAIFTVRKSNQTQVVKATGECGD